MLLDSLAFLHMSVSDILDIVLVALVLYTTYRWIRGSSALNIFIAIILLLIVRIIAVALNMKMISALLGTVIDVGAIAIIVIFQPEVRKFLGNIGRTAGSTLERRNFIEKMFSDKQALGNDTVNEIADACFQMGEQKAGAPILVKPLLNEREVTVANLPQVAPGYYKWDDVKAFWETKLIGKE